MKKKKYKGIACTKRTLSKCSGICRTFGTLETKYADLLNIRDDVESFQTNVAISGEYMTDFVIQMEDGTISIRECVPREHLTKPATIKLLDISKDYWYGRGIKDWGIVTNE